MFKIILLSFFFCLFTSPSYGYMPIDIAPDKTEVWEPEGIKRIFNDEAKGRKHFLNRSFLVVGLIDDISQGHVYQGKKLDKEIRMIKTTERSKKAFFNAYMLDEKDYNMDLLNPGRRIILYCKNLNLDSEKNINADCIFFAVDFTQSKDDSKETEYLNRKLADRIYKLK